MLGWGGDNHGQVGRDGRQLTVSAGSVHLVEPLLKLRLRDAPFCEGFPQRLRGGITVRVGGPLTRIRTGHVARLAADLRESPTRARMGAWSGSAS